MNTPFSRTHVAIGVAHSVAAAKLPMVQISYPLALTDEQRSLVDSRVVGHKLADMSAKDIVTLGFEAERELHEMLDKFLAEIPQVESPELFELFDRLKKGVDDADLATISHELVHGKELNWRGKLARKFASREAIEQAATAAFRAIKQRLSTNGRTLHTLVKGLEQEVATKMKSTETNVVTMETIKDEYFEKFALLVVEASVAYGLLEMSRTELAAAETALKGVNDPLHHAAVEDMRSKLQLLESRAGALQGSSTRLIAESAVLQQVIQGAIGTLQETVTTAGSRFGSIKTTLLALHGASEVAGLQRLNNAAATLDDQLLQIRGKVVNEVVVAAAQAPGDNRLAQANQISGIVSDTNVLMAAVNTARKGNAAKFKQAREIIGTAQALLLQGPAAKQ